jgi:hypothetical protein
MVIRSWYRTQRQWEYTLAILGFGILLMGCTTSEIPRTSCPEPVCPEITCPEPPRYEDLWSSSAHADVTSDAFTNWDDEEPEEIPPDCAKCHSRSGYIDYLGIDGSTSGKVDEPSPTGSTITCYACHNETTFDNTSVVFPSGVKITGLGKDAHCIRCHQGIGSTPVVDDAISEINLRNDDQSSEDLSFISSHSISAATQFGTEVQGAYEYKGKTYVGRFTRGNEFFSCARCHDEHTLEMKSETCHDCHTIAGTELRDIRVDTTDFNGDGDILVGISQEIDSFHSILMEAIKSYAEEEIGIPIGYHTQVYPFFFIDTNLDESIDSEEAAFTNQYPTWTPRLLRAAYNLNYASHDPGAFAHNSDYILQVLYDAIEDIGGDVSKLQRP